MLYILTLRILHGLLDYYIKNKYKVSIDFYKLKLNKIVMNIDFKILGLKN